jgi:fructose-bisphosphate aldolase, class I
LQDEALKLWHGRDENLKVAQEAFHHRAECEHAAAIGKYTPTMEGTSASA